ncbi:MAG: hypothetical protein J6333_02195, partial [Planctomycetes bacterium]|nr:hypothetical protein [Planctomycetota bacterium]
LWAVDAGGPFMSGELFPADGQWHVCYVPFGEFSPAPQHPQRQNAQFSPATIHTLYVGMMSDDAENVLTVSDVYLVGD